ARQSETSLIQRMMQGRAPIADLIGFDATEAGDGRAVIMLQSGPQHFNPMGTLHGGILCDIADTAMGFAFASTLAPDESFTTVELKINFFRSRVHHPRRGEPIDRESGFHLYGTSRP